MKIKVSSPQDTPRETFSSISVGTLFPCRCRNNGFHCCTGRSCKHVRDYQRSRVEDSNCALIYPCLQPRLLSMPGQDSSTYIFHWPTRCICRHKSERRVHQIFNQAHSPLTPLLATSSPFVGDAGTRISTSTANQICKTWFTKESFIKYPVLQTLPRTDSQTSARNVVLCRCRHEEPLLRVRPADRTSRPCIAQL